MSEDINPDEELIHCIYASAAIKDFSKEELFNLLETSRENNEKLDVTGMLLYHQGSFFQVLEGKKCVVESLFNKIAKDKRHDMVLKLIVEPIEFRDFEGWTMGHAHVSEEDIKSIPGLNDAVIKRGFFGELPIGRARELLEAFKKGKWRQTIE